MNAALASLLLCGLLSTSVFADERMVDKVRFFPAPGGEKLMLGGKFTGSNVSERAGYETLAAIDAAPPAGQWTEMPLPTSKGYRWYRYEAPPGSHGDVAEIEFFSNGKKVNTPSNAFGSLGNRNLHAWSLAEDGKTDTYFDSDAADDQYVGFDFGDRADPPPVFETPPGLLAGEPKVTLKPADGATIRYAFGGAPTAESGTAYRGPITPDRSTTTIFARAFRPGRAPSAASSASYFAGSQLDPGRTSLTVGNSLSGLSQKLPDFFIAARRAHESFGFYVGGASPPGIYKNFIANPDRKNKDTSWNDLMGQLNRVDDCVIQVFSEKPDDEAGADVKIFDLIRAKYPEMQPWFYDIWEEMFKTPPHAVAIGQVPSPQMKKLAPGLTWEEKDAAWTLYNEDIRVRVLPTYQGKKKPMIIPCGLAVAWLKNMLEHGKIPGLTADDFPFIMFRDNFHPGPIGRYLIALTWYSALYGDSPVGKVAPIDTDLTPEQAGILQKLAWDTVQNYPYAGIYQEGAAPAEPPQFSPTPAGPISAPIQVTLGSATPGAWFRYTLDGTTPTHTVGYTYCGVISAQPGMTIKAVAFKNGLADSSVRSVAYRGQ